MSTQRHGFWVTGPFYWSNSLVYTRRDGFWVTGPLLVKFCDTWGHGFLAIGPPLTLIQLWKNYTLIQFCTLIQFWFNRYFKVKWQCPSLRGPCGPRTTGWGLMILWITYGFWATMQLYHFRWKATWNPTNYAPLQLSTGCLLLAPSARLLSCIKGNILHIDNIRILYKIRMVCICNFILQNFVSSTLRKVSIL